MITYKDAGVDTEAGVEAVSRIQGRVRKTWQHVRGRVVPDVGFIGHVIERKDGTVSALKTDSAGTKALITALMGRHDTIGQDAVAMVLNDLAVGGITPEYLVDFILMGKQVPERTEEIVSGIARACERARCALVGGEMAEVPGMLAPDHYEVAAAAVGYASSLSELITGDKIVPGMGVFGYPSDGVHSNGFSLVRRVFGIDANDPIASRKVLDVYYAELGHTLGEELSVPTAVYVDIIEHVRSTYAIAGMAHITGGGMVEKIPRILPKNCAASINEAYLPHMPVFDLIQSTGKIERVEMLKTFNCGIGFVAVSSDDLTPAGFIGIGEIIPGDGNTKFYYAYAC